MRVRAKSQLQLADTQRQPRTGDVRAGGDPMDYGWRLGRRVVLETVAIGGVSWEGCLGTKLSGPLGHSVL